MLPIRLRWFALACALLGCWSETRAQNADDFSAIAKAADSAREAGNAEEAIHDYGRALALRPDWVEGWWELGTTQYEANQYADAIPTLRRLTQLAPKSAAGWDILGLTEFETKDYNDALAHLEKARALAGIDDPEIARVSAYHLSLLLIRAGNFDRALELLPATFGTSPPQQVKAALGLALLRVPLLPTEVDPSKDALVQAAGDAAVNPDPKTLNALTEQYPNTPWVHYFYGLVLAKNGETQQALVEQKAEAAISSESALPWIEISKLSLSLKRTRDASNAAQHAVSLDHENAVAHEALAKALTAAGQPQLAVGETREAARLTHKPATRDPSMIALYAANGGPASLPGNSAAWTTAMQDYSTGKYPEAIAALKDWVEQNPTDGTAWAVMGLSEFAAKDFDNARIHLQRGINLGLKGSGESLQLATGRLGLLLIRDGQFEEATALLKRVAGKPPMAKDAQLALGLALLHLAKMPDELDPSQRELAQSAGAIVELLFASRYAEASPAFDKLIAEHPATPWLHYAYGDALESLSHYDEAKTQMVAELKVSPKNALPWVRISSIDLRQHLSGDALQAAQNAVTFGPTLPVAHYELGRAWLENGNAQKAIEELEKANDIKPNAPEIHFALARAYAKANQPEKAADERAAFMRLNAMADHQAPDTAQGQSILQPNSQ